MLFDLVEAMIVELRVFHMLLPGTGSKHVG